MTNDELLTKVKQQLQRCAGWETDDVAKDREKALDYYFMRVRGDEIIGRSQVVSGDVSAMVEAVMSQMLDAFTTDNIVEFDPMGQADEDQVQLEADTVSHFVMKENNGFLQLAQAIKDALLLRNGIMKVWVEERTRSKTKSFEGVTPEILSALTEQPGIDTKINEYDPDSGNLSIRFSKTTRAFKSESLPLENFFYLKDWDSLDLQDIPFCAERHLDRRSDLIEMGYPKAAVNRLPAFRSSGKVDANARNLRKLTTDNIGIDKSQDVIEWYECYVLVGGTDGISERRRLCISGEELLSNHEVSLVPYAAGAAIINPHRFTGISLYDKLKQVQDINTSLQRALLDNVNTTTKNRLAYLDGKVNVEDVSDGRPNGSIRVKANVGDVRTAVMPFAVPDLSVGIMQNIEFQKSVRTELGGAALDLASGSAQIGGEGMGSQGLDRAYSVMEQLSSTLTKTIAASLIRSTFLLAHATLREYFDEPVPIKREGKWATPVPSEWPERTRLTVKVGMSPGERSRRAGALMQILNSQVQLAQLGMDEVLVNLDGFHATLMDWARSSDIQNPEQYFVDPQSQTAQQALQTKAKSAEEQKQLQQSLMQQAIGLEQMGKALEKYKADQETQFKYWSETLRAEIEEAKIVGSATVDLLAAKEKPDAESEAGSVDAAEDAATA